jgi:hypothetical protein
MSAIGGKADIAIVHGPQPQKMKTDIGDHGVHGGQCNGRGEPWQH